MLRYFILIICFIGWAFVSNAQSYTPGIPYFSTHGYIEYIPGTLPIVISVPHGGYLEPEVIPDRTCFDAVHTNDAYTQELSRNLLDAIYAEFGCYPHLVINHLHRSKLDANRSLSEGACGNDSAILAWHAFNDFLDSAEAQIMLQYGKGLYIDLHGHGHPIQRIELGYLLYADELQLSDATLNADPYLAYSSIQYMAENNLFDHTHAELLRGMTALGSLLEASGYPTVPSLGDPFPEGDEPYFSGGYNTAERSSYNGGSIDGIQIECNMQGVRNSSENRERFADTLAGNLHSYLLQTHFTETTLLGCSDFVSIQHTHSTNDLRLIQNPVQDMLLLSGRATQVYLFDLHGRCVDKLPDVDGFIAQPVAHLPAGVYVIRWADADRSDTLTWIKQ